MSWGDWASRPSTQCLPSGIGLPVATMLAAPRCTLRDRTRSPVSTARSGPDRLVIGQGRACLGGPTAGAFREAHPDPISQICHVQVTAYLWITIQTIRTYRSLSGQLRGISCDADHTTFWSWRPHRYQAEDHGCVPGRSSSSSVTRAAIGERSERFSVMCANSG